MGWKKAPATVTPVVSPGEPMVASAALYPVADVGQTWRNYRFTDAAWQLELWRLYDCVPEFHFLVNYIGGACGRVRVYAADVDSNGRIQQETDDQDVADLVDNMLGGPEAKSECIRSIAINMEVAGEVWIIGRTNPKNNSDEWLIVSSVELRRFAGGYYVGYGEDRIELIEGRDILIRTWTPHPRRMMYPDSPSRAVYPILIEIEKLTAFIFSQLNSRLANAGLLVLPQAFDFPQADPETPKGVPSFVKTLVETAAANMKGEATAAGVVPIVIQAPNDYFDKIKDPIKFESVLSDQAVALRDEALKRLSWGMDTPPEAMTGMGDSNHWSAWHVDEGTIKSVIEPLMNRICDALNKAYFVPALTAMGKDPKKFVLAFDTSGLTVRPQRLQDTLNLNAAGIASDEAVRLAGDYKLTDKPSDEERNMKFMQQLMLRDPQLVQNPEAAKIAGLPTSFVDSVASATPPPPPPAPDVTVVPHSMLPPIPENSKAPGNPNGNVPQAVTSAAYDMSREAVLMAAESAAYRALELAGNRLLTAGVRGQLTDVPKHEIHTRVSVRNMEHARNLVSGSFAHLESQASRIGADPVLVQAAVASYCTTQLVTGKPHDLHLLAQYLDSEGVFGRG